MEERRRRSDSAANIASGSSGSYEVRRRRVSGAFDVAGAHRALELLAENSLYGSIVVSDGLVDVCFFFTRGGLRVVTSGRKLPSLADRLRQKGTITLDDQRKAEKLLAAQREKGAEQGKAKALLEERESLIEAAKVKPQDVDEVAREVIAEAMLDCLFWENPQFEAATGEPNQEIMQRRDLSAVTLSLGVADLVEKLQQKIRSVSEIRRTVSSLRVVVEPTTKGREAVEKRERLGEGPVGERRTKLMALVTRDAGVRAPDLAAKLGIGELEMASLLHELTVQGYVRLDRPPVDKKEELERVRKMEEAIDQALSQLLRRVRLADESAAQGDGARAARHLARAGGLLLQEGRDDEAARTFGGALKHSQEDLEAREGYVQSLWATGRTTEAMDQSEELGRRYLDLNLPARAKKILERAIGREERTGTLDLLVTTLVKLKMGKAATEAGERLVNRLRREGKRDEARDAAARLLEIADADDRARILRAAGVDTRRAVVLVATLVAIVLVMTPVSAAKSAREQYHTAATEAREALTRKQPLDDLLAALVREEQRFADLSTQLGGEPGLQAKAAHEQLGALRQDLQACAGRLRGDVLPWRDARDLDLARGTIQEARKAAATDQVRTALDRLLADLETFRNEAETELSRLETMAPGTQSVAEARRLVTVYHGLPELLRGTQLRILVGSQPPGARVMWDGISYKQTTPLSLALPLKGERHLQLSLDGFRDGEAVVNLDGLADSGVVELELAPAPSTPDEPPTPVKPDPPVRRPDPPPTPPRPPIAVQPNTPPPAPTPPPPDQRIEVRDEVIGDGSAFVFESSVGYFESSLHLPSIYRAAVFVVNEVQGQTVRLTALRVHLVTRTRSGWTMQRRGVVRKLSDPFERVVQVRDGKKVVLKLDSPHLFIPGEIKEEAQEGFEEALKEYRHQREGR